MTDLESVFCEHIVTIVSIPEDGIGNVKCS